jgi:predicted RNase H-like nuclease (RuvC/YqgF family)
MAEVINKEYIREKLKDNRPKSHYETYQNEITEYMVSKLAEYNVPIHTIMEITQYCFQGTLLVAHDEVRRAYRHWSKRDRKSGCK